MTFSLPSAPTQSARSHRVKAIAVAVVAAVALVATCVSHRWFVPRDSEAGHVARAPTDGFSLLSFEGCFAGGCERKWNKEVIDRLNGFTANRSGSTMFAAFGIVAFGCLVFAIGALVAGAGLALLGRRLTPPVAPTIVAMIGLIITVLAVIGMAATRPDLGAGLTLDVGWAFWLYAGGVIAGLAGALMLDRHLRRDEVEVDLPQARQIVR
jgi:hypothetical protein